VTVVVLELLRSKTADQVRVFELDTEVNLICDETVDFENINGSTIFNMLDY